MHLLTLLLIAYVGWVVLRENWHITKNTGYMLTRPSAKVSSIRILLVSVMSAFFVNGLFFEIIIIAAIGADVFYSYREFVSW